MTRTKKKQAKIYRSVNTFTEYMTTTTTNAKARQNNLLSANMANEKLKIVPYHAILEEIYPIPSAPSYRNEGKRKRKNSDLRGIRMQSMDFAYKDCHLTDYTTADSTIVDAITKNLYRIVCCRDTTNAFGNITEKGERLFPTGIVTRLPVYEVRMALATF